MLICETCGATFDERNLIRRQDADETDQCPFCHDDFISEAKACARCRTVKSVLTNDHLLIDGICDECLAACVKEYNDLIQTLPKPVYGTLCNVFGELLLTA